MYKFNKIRCDIIKQCHGNYKEMKKFNNKLETKTFGYTEGFFLRVSVSKKAPRHLPAG